MNRLRWIVPGAALLALDVYLCAFRWSDMVGNIEAQFLIVTPAFGAHHFAVRRQSKAQHRELTERLDAQDAAIGTTVGKVGELHDWHLRGILPPDVLKP